MTRDRIVFLAAALLWGAFASAQVTDAETGSGGDASGEELPTEIPEELLQSQTMEEIEVVVGPQGQSAFELEMQRQAADPAEIDRILADGAARAREIASPVMDTVKDIVGLLRT